jgi:hypothetical protein
MSSHNISVHIDKIKTNTLYSPIGTGIPSAGINGELGQLALQSEISNIPKSISGFLPCDTINYVYYIDHSSSLVSAENTVPYVSLSLPSSASLLYVSGITERNSGGFYVVLSGIPETTGYTINWNLLSKTTFNTVGTSAGYLLDQLNTEIANRILSDTNLQNQINLETSNRQSEDGLLQSSINTNIVSISNLSSQLHSVSGYLQDEIDLLNLTDLTQNNRLDEIETTLAGISGGSASSSLIFAASANAYQQSYTLISENTFNLNKKLERDRTGLLVPLYVYPLSGANIPEYLDLIALKNTYHTVPLYVIINPGIIPASTLDLNYELAIKRLKSCNAKVIGYVATTYTSASSIYVKSQIDTWTNLYDIDGMMFDEMTSDINQTHYDYYTDLTNYCHTKNLYPVIGNAGTTVPSGYFDNASADIFLVYEAAGYTSEDVMKNGYGEAGNYQLYPYTSRAHLFHTVEYSSTDLTIAQKYTGLLYATSDEMPNPWDTISPYMESLFSLLYGNISGGGSSTQYTENAGVVYSVKSGDNRTLTPSDVSLGTPGFQFMFGSVNANDSSPYADIITCSTWYDGTGGGINQILFDKTDGTTYHKFGTFGASGWNWTRKFWDEGNDGAGSGLDADLLDGVQGSYYIDELNHKTKNSNYIEYSILPGDIRTVSPCAFGPLGHYFYFTSLNNDDSNPYADAITLNSYADGSAGGVNTILLDKSSTNVYHRQGTFGSSGAFGSLIKFWDDANDGATSGLDADLLDGQHGSYYTNLINQKTSSSNYVTYSISPGDLRTVSPSSFGGLGHYFYFTALNNDSNSPWADAITLNSYSDGTGGVVNTLLFDKFSTNIYHKQGTYGAANFGSLIKIWDDSNDGASSGLDADLLDGQHGSYYTNYSNSTSANSLAQSITIAASMSANAYQQAINSAGGDTYWTSINKNQPVSTQTVYVSASQNRTYVGCNVTGGPIMVVLPNSAYVMQEVLVKHEGGNITNNNITVSGGLYNIDDFPAHILDQDYSGFIYIYVNSQWRIF